MREDTMKSQFATSSLKPGVKIQISWKKEIV